MMLIGFSPSSLVQPPIVISSISTTETIRSTITITFVVLLDALSRLG